MNRWVNLVAQLLGFATQVIIPTFVVDPTKRTTIQGVVAGVQGIVGIVAHSYNPDGTPAVVAYVPKKN
jgi:hypothetical protein